MYYEVIALLPFRCWMRWLRTVLGGHATICPDVERVMLSYDLLYTSQQESVLAAVVTI